MRCPASLAFVACAVVGAAWLGLQVTPAPFPPFPFADGPLEAVPLRDGLPAAVGRYYRAAFTGGVVPLVRSAVLTGRGVLRFGVVKLPTRFRFTHDAGRGYRHYFEATWFGLPVLKVNEAYLDGRGRMEFPLGIVVEGPKTSSAANLGMWAEAMGFPSIYVTDPRVRWEPIDAEHARLVVPGPDGEEAFTVEFDPTAASIKRIETLRWRSEDDPARLRWVAADLGDRSAAIWEDDPPWLIFRIEEVVLNADVSQYVRGRGL